MLNHVIARCPARLASFLTFTGSGNEHLENMATSIATMSIPTVVPHQHPPTVRGLSALGRHGGRRPSADENGPNSGKGVEGLYWDNEDESFEVPDFHFDWGVTKEKEKTSTNMNMGLESRLEDLNLVQIVVPALRQSQESDVISVLANATPPLRYAHSERSSASSARVMSFDDASKASASTPLPTPPNSSAPLASRSMSSRQPDTGGSGSGQSGRMYGARNFQRVVSAPLTRQKYEFEGINSSADDTNVSLNLLFVKLI